MNAAALYISLAADTPARTCLDRIHTTRVGYRSKYGVSALQKYEWALKILPGIWWQTWYRA